MKHMSMQAKLYTLLVILVGSVFGAWLLGNFPIEQKVALVVAAIIASALQIFKAEGATTQTSFNLSWIAYAIVFMQFGMAAAFAVIFVAHLTEWFWYRYPWYIQAFNIASFAIVVAAAAIAARFSLLFLGATSFGQVLSTLVALLVFTAGNHVLVGQAIRLNNGRSISDQSTESQQLANQAFLMDFGLLCLGASAAFLWMINPFTIVFLFVVVYLLHRVLRVPALEREVYRDPKTGLYNAEFLNRKLRKELLRMRRPDRPLCVVMADLDLLREINNTYGHIAGDAVIKKVAQILLVLSRESDVVARFGGEEFVVLMPDTTSGEAYVLAEAMRKAIEVAEFTVSDDITPIKVTMSFGIAECEDATQQPVELLHDADLAMYEAKELGRNQSCVYDSWTPEIAPIEAYGTILAKADNQMSTKNSSTQSDAVTSTTVTQITDSMSQAGRKQRTTLPFETVERQGDHRNAVNWFVGGMVAISLILTVVLVRPIPLMDIAGLLLFVALAATLEWLGTEDNSIIISVPTSTATLIGATMLFGPIGALTTGLAIAAVAQYQRHWYLDRFVFRSTNLVLGGLVCAGLLTVTGVVYLELSIMWQVFVASACALAFFVSNTALAAAYGSFYSSQPWYRIWYERYVRQVYQYAGMGLLAFSLIYFYLLVGALGVLIMLIPLALLHYGQREYLHATKQSIIALQATYDELETKNQEIEKLNEELLLALASTIDLRDPDVIEHSRQVARYAVMTAEEMGLDRDHLNMVRRAGLMHDIGKLAIPEAILFKPDRLTDEEYEIIKEHVTIGADLLDDFVTLQSVAFSVRHHHERWDGNGYPDRLAGEEIPVEARILALADSVEAMASDRAYRAGMDVDEILKEVTAMSGTQFDPDVVAAFGRVIEKRGRETIVNSAREQFELDDYTDRDEVNELDELFFMDESVLMEL